MNAPTLGQAEGTTLMAAGLVALVAVIYVFKRGPGQVAADAGKAAAGAVAAAAGGVATGVADAGSGVVGIPTTEQTTTDPSVARWLIDNYGYWDAVKWSGAPALFSAIGMDAGTGTPPPAGSAVAVGHAGSADSIAAAAQLKSGAIDYGAPSDNPYGW